jgi:hypothetical protein
MRRHLERLALLLVGVAATLASLMCSPADREAEKLGKAEELLPGAPVVSAPFRIGESRLVSGSASIAAVAAGPEGYLAVYVEPSTSYVDDQSRLIAVHVGADGSVPNPFGTTLATDRHLVITVPVRVVRTNVGWLIAFTTADSVYGVRVVVLSDAGTVGSVNIVASDDSVGGLVWMGDRALLTTQHGNGYFLGADGAVGWSSPEIPDRLLM